MSVNEQKEQLRRLIRNKRRGFSEKSYRIASEKLHSKLFQWDHFCQSSIIHCFLNTVYEPATKPVISHCWNNKQQVAVPCMEAGSLTLKHSFLDSFEHLKIGLYQILQPRKEQYRSIDINAIDLILVPGVAFDRRGGRLGHGKGYYDRFLEQARAFRLGIAFNFQLLDSIPQDSHDIRMNAVLTETGFIYPES